MVLNSQVIMVLPPFPLINHPGATRKTRKKNANSILNENITLKPNIYETEAKCSEEQTRYKQSLGQKCLQLQILDPKREN